MEEVLRQRDRLYFRGLPGAQQCVGDTRVRAAYPGVVFQGDSETGPVQGGDDRVGVERLEGRHVHDGYVDVVRGEPLRGVFNPVEIMTTSAPSRSSAALPSVNW